MFGTMDKGGLVYLKLLTGTTERNIGRTVVSGIGKLGNGKRQQKLGIKKYLT